MVSFNTSYHTTKTAPTTIKHSNTNEQIIWKLSSELIRHSNSSDDRRLGNYSEESKRGPAIEIGSSNYSESDDVDQIEPKDRLIIPDLPYTNNTGTLDS